MASPLDFNPLSTAPQAAVTPTPYDATPRGILSNTVKGIVGTVPLKENPWLQVLGSIGQGIARTVGSLGLSVQNQVYKQIAPSLVAGKVQVPDYLKPVFGDDGTVSDVPTRIAAAKAQIDSNPFAQKLGLTKISAPLAIGALVGNTALDLSGLGGSDEQALKALAEEVNPEKISSMLQKTGLNPEIADQLALHVASAQTPKEVQNILDVAKSFHGLQAIKDGAAEDARVAEPAIDYAAQDSADERAPAVASKNTPVDPILVGKFTAAQAPEDAAKILKESFPNIPDAMIAKTVEKAPSFKTPQEVETALRGLRNLDTTMSEGNVVKASAIDERLAPLADKDGMLTVYRAAANFPKETFAKDTHFATDPKNARYYAESHYSGDPSDIEVRPVQVPASILKRGGSADSWQLKDEYPVSPANISKERASTIDHEGPVLNSKNLENGTAENKIAETVAPELSKSPNEAIAKLISGPDGKSWQGILKGYIEHAPRVKTANIFSYLGTPEFVLERMGLGKSAEMLQDAKDEALTLKGEFLNKVISWKSEIDAVSKDAKNANVRIFKFLDGDSRIKPSMSEAELKVAGEIKDWLSHLADRLNLPAENRISNYITHIFERTSEVNPKETVFDDPDLQALMDQPAKSVHDPFLQARTGKKGYREDTWAALDAYAKRASRKIAMDPALEKMSEEAKKLDGAAYQYITTLSHNINMRPSHVDTLIDNFLKETPGIGNRFGQRPIAAITQKTRRVLSRGMYGLNFRNALNNLSQGANTYAKLGEKYTTVGYFKLFSKMITGDMEDLYRSHVLEDAFVEQDKKLGVYKSALQKLDPKLFAMQRAAETINRGAAYYGAEAQALKKGLSPEQAVKYAKRIVRETQFSFSSVDVPAALNSDLAKTITQNLGYNIKQFEFLKRMAKSKDVAGLIRYSLASFVFMQTIGKIYGMTIDQLIPTVGLGGNPTLSTIKDIGDVSFGTAQAKATAIGDLKTRLAQLLPAGGQIKKTVQGLDTVASGKYKSSSGKTTLFKVPKTAGNYVRAALFGRSALPEAQAYYYKLDHPKAKNKAKASL